MSDQQQQQPTMNAGPQQPPLQFHFHFCYFIPTTTTAFSSQSNHDQQQERPQYQQPGNYMTNEMFNQFLAQMFQAHMNTTVGHNNNQQNQVKATKKSILSQLPVYSCDTSDSYQSQFGDCTCECSICLSDSEQDEKLMKLPCTHTFHKDCVLPWLQNHHSCPVCRFELPIEVVQPSHNNKLLNDQMDDEENRGVKQRMMEQYGPESLQLMEIGSDIQRSYSELQQWEKEKKQAESTMDESSLSSHVTLNSLEIQLNRSMDKLDGLIIPSCSSSSQGPEHSEQSVDEDGDETMSTSEENNDESSTTSNAPSRKYSWDWTKIRQMRRQLIHRIQALLTRIDQLRTVDSL